MSRGYTHPLRRVYTRFASALCLLYAGLYIVCRRFEFARHFPFICACEQLTISDEHSIVTMLHSTRIIRLTNTILFLKIRRKKIIAEINRNKIEKLLPEIRSAE